MGNKWEVKLSARDLNRLAKDFKTYYYGLDQKCEQFVERLVNEVGIPTVESRYGKGKGDSSKSHNVYVEMHRVPNQFVEAKLVVQGKDILFIEFGAGIIYNKGKEHPNAKELGYGVGTYPNQRHAFDDDGWYYWDGTTRVPSKGTEASMPVYEAYREMSERVRDIAREVFADV